MNHLKIKLEIHQEISKEYFFKKLTTNSVGIKFVNGKKNYYFRIYQKDPKFNITALKISCFRRVSNNFLKSCEKLKKAR